jgi:Ca2+-binding RTX toxin-like protein
VKLWGSLVGVVMTVALVVPAGANAETLGTALSGQITVTGTGGKDNLDIEFSFEGARSRYTMVVTPAATVTATSGSCPPNTDPLTGRPTVTECVVTPSSQTTLVVDALAGDDTVIVEDSDFVMGALRLNGGLGNDVLEAAALTGRTLRGEDGNDTLIAGGPMSGGTNPAVGFDGGAGTDTAAWDDPSVATSGPNQDLGVTASLASGTATLAGVNNQSQPTTFRTDTLTAIEGLIGTDVGDVLIGNAGANTLSGGRGNDNLNGGDGADSLLGGDDLDNLIGGKAADTVDGGLGIDTYPPDSGADTFNTRDGFLEQVTCVKGDAIANDLVDTVASNTAANACSVSTAAAKHRYDTKLSGKPARVVDGELRTKVRCPGAKPETCEGELEALLGKRKLGRAAYDVAPGKKVAIGLPISKGNARRAEGKRIVLSASEVDADGRDRFVSRPTRVR